MPTTPGAPRLVVGIVTGAFCVTGSVMFLGIVSIAWGAWQLLAVTVVIGLPQLVVSQVILRRSGGWSAGHRARVLVLFGATYAAALSLGLILAAREPT